MNWRLVIGIFLVINFSCQREIIQNENLLIYGHAGTSLYPERAAYPPNTFESVKYAINVLNADGVEVDVQMTKDSVLVLFHDGFLDEVTNFSGCVQEYNFHEISEMKIYGSPYRIATLEEVIDFCLGANVFVFLDMKPYNFCESKNGNYITINNALNNVISDLSVEEKKLITINSRNIDLLNSISDTSMIKSFETENISLAIQNFNADLCDEVSINYFSMNDEVLEQLNNHTIPFSIFGVKIKSEIEGALKFYPTKIITDNISYTRKISN